MYSKPSYWYIPKFLEQVSVHTCIYMELKCARLLHANGDFVCYVVHTYVVLLADSLYCAAKARCPLQIR